MRPRQVMLGLVLAGTLAAAFWPRQEAALVVVEPAHKSAGARHPVADRPATAAIAATNSPSSQPDRPRFGPGVMADLFPSQSFRPPPPPPPRPLPPPPPMAPPVPFTFIGAWTEGGQETLFLAQGDRTLTVQKGGKLAGGWRLDERTPDALVFTYEPLNQPRTLRIAP